MDEYRIVNRVKWHGTGIFEIQLERNGLEFTPGDCMALFDECGETSRPYSLASGTGSEYLAFIVRHMPGGEVSEYLSSCKPGDRVKSSPPFGWFRPGNEEYDGPDVFVATGTGISPFLSHFRSRPHRPPACLLYGVRRFEDAVDPDWLRAHCNLKLAISREAVNGYHQGRVTDLLGDLPLDADAHYYLCGLDAMIDETTAWLEGQGIDITHIHRECFFNADFED